MQDLTWGSILLGLAIDFGGTFLVSVALAMAAGFFAPGWVEDESIQQRGMKRLMTTRFLVIGLVLGLLFTVAGGFISSGASLDNWWANAFVMGMLSLAGYCVMAYYSEAIVPSPLWYHIVSVILFVPAALLGGWIRVFV